MPGFFADECVGRAIVEGLVDRGLDVLDASVVCKGEDDERVLSLAAAAGRIVITSDWGGRPAVGVIILSLYALSADLRERTAIYCGRC